MYAESNGKSPGSKATLSSPWVRFNTNCKVRFAFYMYDDSKDSLWLNVTDSYSTNGVCKIFFHLLNHDYVRLFHQMVAASHKNKLCSFSYNYRLFAYSTQL